MPKKTKATPKPAKPQKGARKTPSKPKKGGRSLYRPEYCALAIRLGGEGKSRTQIAVAIGVTKRTVDKWAEENEAFGTALELAHDTAQAFFEGVAARGMMMGNTFNHNAWWHLMRCRFGAAGYRDARELEVSGAVAGEPVKLVVSHLESGL